MTLTTLGQRLLRVFSPLSPEMFRSFLTLFAGTTLAQLAPLLSGPILSRLYAPEDFGLFALLSSVAAIASIASTGALEHAVVTAREDEEADSLTVIAAGLSLGFSILSALVILAVVLIASPWGRGPEGWLWLLVPLASLLFGLTSVASYALNREKQYGILARGKVLRAVFMALAQIGFGLIRMPWGLFPGLVVGQWATAAYLTHATLARYRRALGGIDGPRIRAMLRQYYRFPAFTAPSQMVNELSVQTPIYMLTALFAAAVVGLYALPQKFMNLPVILIGHTIGQVFFQRVSECVGQPAQLAQVTRSTFLFVFRVGVLPFSVVLVFGDMIFGWVFGPQWAQSGVYAQMLSPWLLLNLAGAPISRLYTVLGRHRLGLCVNLTLLALRLLALLIGGLVLGSPDLAILLFGLIGFAYWVFNASFSLRLGGVHLPPVVLEVLILWGAALAPLLLLRLALV